MSMSFFLSLKTSLHQAFKSDAGLTCSACVEQVSTCVHALTNILFEVQYTYSHHSRSCCKMLDHQCSKITQYTWIAPHKQMKVKQFSFHKTHSSYQENGAPDNHMISLLHSAMHQGAYELPRQNSKISYMCESSTICSHKIEVSNSNMNHSDVLRH